MLQRRCPLKRIAAGFRPQINSASFAVYISAFFGERQFPSALSSLERPQVLDSAGGHALRIVAGVRLPAVRQWRWHVDAGGWDWLVGREGGGWWMGAVKRGWGAGKQPICALRADMICIQVQMSCMLRRRGRSLPRHEFGI